jgi:hypothetical protein
METAKVKRLMQGEEGVGRIAKDAVTGASHTTSD